MKLVGAEWHAGVSAVGTKPDTICCELTSMSKLDGVVILVCMTCPPEIRYDVAKAAMPRQTT